MALQTKLIKMINGKRVVVVMPAYNAEKTLPSVIAELPFNIVDELVLVDDASNDKTFETAQKLGIKHIIKHNHNKGYGANQKTCYQKALQLKADIVVMLHPDYQYPPALIPALCQPVATGIYSVMLGSRILSGGALKGGMPKYKYIANRLLTIIQNFLMRQALSEYHTGYRAFDAKILTQIALHSNSDNFVFDNQMLAQILFKGFKIGEVSCPTRYFSDASSINFWRSITYGLGVIKVSVCYVLAKLGLYKARFLL